MTISVKHMFERRLGLFPVTFDADGTMHADTALGDYPQIAPALRTDRRASNRSGDDAAFVRQEERARRRAWRASAPSAPSTRT